MIINAERIINMWDNKGLNKEERRNETKALVKYMKKLKNPIDFCYLTININSMK